MIHPQHRIKPALAVALAVTACTAGPAAARPIVYSPPAHATQSQGSTNLCSEVCVGDGYKAPQLGEARTGAQLPHNPLPHSPVTPTGATSSDNGFDWGDAAIGAGGTIALVGLAGGGVYAITRRGRQPRQAV